MNASSAQVAMFTAPRSVQIADCPLDAVGAGDIRVRTLYSAISHGTEMNVYRGLAPQWNKVYDRGLRLFRTPTAEEMKTPKRGYWTPSDPVWNYPLAYGYANVGRVEEIGGEAAGLQVGDIVYAYRPHQSAYVASAGSVIRLPELPHPAHGVLLSNIHTAYNGVLDTKIGLDDTVVIFGQGLIGLIVTQLVRRSPARRIVTVDRIAKRRELSVSLGAHLSLDPAEVDVALEVRKMTDGRGADVTIDVSGSYAALQEAIRTAAPNTTVTAMSWYGGSAEALRLADEFHHNRITIKSSQVGAVDPHRSATWSMARRGEAVLREFGRLQLAPLLTNVIPFSDAAAGYKLVDELSDQMIQVVFDYTNP